jgi:hypothetical protein
MTDTFRALCAEILQKLDQYEDDQRVDWDAWRNNARAALAQPEPVAPTDEGLLRMAASAIGPYESSGIAIGEYEPETECAVHAYGSELIAYARAVLAQPVPVSERLPEREPWRSGAWMPGIVKIVPVSANASIPTPEDTNG